MPIKIYGIILSNVQAKMSPSEGLHRWLAEFLTEISVQIITRFVIVCPSKKYLLDFCYDEGIPTDGFDVVSPAPLQVDNKDTSLPPDQKEEAEALLDIINKMQQIKVWYSPTPFSPWFNKIKVPILICVPDVVLIDFPIGFATHGNDEQRFLDVEQCIRSGQYFLTYSEHIKQHTLMAHYAIDANKVHVVHHAPNNLSRWITFSGPNEQENRVGSLLFCHTLLERALYKATSLGYGARGFTNTSIKFLFYASQVRATKNILTFLRAYNYLLRNRYITHKLILTGHPHSRREVWEFVDNHGLSKDVLFLYGLNNQELAACYKLADLAVNPSLSEGGFPFTFSESLSVGTPVVMARIPVTTEIITDTSLQNMMLFDPYRWEDVASRIEWALNNKQTLLEAQMPFWNTLSKRTWRHVVDEHIEILDRIAEEESEKDISNCTPLKHYVDKEEFFSRFMKKAYQSIIALCR